jgi:hypothetical protein
VRSEKATTLSDLHLYRRGWGLNLTSEINKFILLRRFVYLPGSQASISSKKGFGIQMIFEIPNIFVASGKVAFAIAPTSDSC